MNTVSHLLRELAARRDADLSDEQLLERFVASREEAAFEGLVRRHGPMVLGVCRRTLGNNADTEDAFQATFLVLARKADTIRPPGHVASFLHGVARRTALKARGAAFRRANRERQVDQMPEPQVLPQDGEDLLALIDEELERLPQRYRMTILLCAIQGRSYKDAAEQLGCAEGTVGAWLCRAREMLAARLNRRGLAVPVGGAVVLLVQGSAHAMPSALVHATTQSACLFAAGEVSSGVAVTLAEGVLHAMFTSKIKIGLAVLFALTFVSSGVYSLGAIEQRTADSSSTRRAQTPTTAREMIAAPPAPESPNVLKLINRLGDDDENVRNEAQKKLEAMGENVVPTLEGAAKRHSDVDVRLRAAVIAAAINKKIYGEVDSFVGHTQGVTAVAVSPDGKQMVSASQFEDFPRIWDVRTGKELFQLKEHKRNVAAVTWSKDGKHVITGGYDCNLILWDAKTGKLVKTITGHTDMIYGVDFTPDGKKVVSCSKERVVRIWDIETGKEVGSNSDHPVAVRSVMITPDGKHFVTACFDGGIRLFEVETGKLVRKMDSTHSQAWFVAVSPDSKRAASVGEDKLVMLHDLVTGKLVRQFTGHTESTHAIAFTPDGKRLFSGALDRTARLWEIETGKEIQRFAHSGMVTCAAVLPNGRQGITSCNDRTLRLWMFPR